MVKYLTLSNFRHYLRFRRNPGLIRKSRKLVVELAHILYKVIPKLEKELNKQIDCANEEGTEKIFIEVIQQFKKLENDIGEIDKNEIIVLDRTLKREIAEQKLLNDFNKKYKKFFLVIGDQNRDSLNKSVGNLNYVRKIIHDDFTKIRKLSKDLLEGRPCFDPLVIKTRTISTDALISEMERKFPNQREAATSEKSLDKKVKKDIESLDQLFKKFNENVDKVKNKDLNPQQNATLLKEEFKKISKKVTNNIQKLEKHTNHYKKVVNKEMNLLSMVYISLFVMRERFKKKENQLKEKELNLKKMGISGDVIKHLDEIFKQLDKLIHKHVSDELDMAVHEHYTDSAAAESKKFKQAA